MDIEQIRKTVRAAIESIAPEAGLHGIRPDRPLRLQVDLDSMDWLNVIATLQDRLSVEIPESDYGRLESLDSIAAYLAARRDERPGRPRGQPVKASTRPVRTEHLLHGERVTVRAIEPADAKLEADFINGLSEEARYMRFMATVREPSRAKLASLTNVDQSRDLALAATVDRNGASTMVGAARYHVDAADDGCEFAIAVADAWQGTGLAGVLMQALIDAARGRGLRTIEGLVLAANRRMLKLARQLGFRQLPVPDSRDTVRVVREL